MPSLNRQAEGQARPPGAIHERLDPADPERRKCPSAHDELVTDRGPEREARVRAHDRHWTRVRRGWAVTLPANAPLLFEPALVGGGDREVLTGWHELADRRV